MTVGEALSLPLLFRACVFGWRVPRPAQYEFAQADSILQVCTAREATSLPYSFVGVPREFSQPGATLSAGTARQITIYVLHNPIPILKNKPAGRCRSAGQFTYFGNRTRMVVPSPRRLSTWILALWSRAACLTMLSPRPVPPTSLERLLSTR